MDKIKKNFADFDILKSILKIIDNIPSHLKPPKSLKEIASSVSEDNGISKEIIIGITASVIAFFDAFGVVEWNGTSCKIGCQNSHYFRNSIIWYFTNHQKLFTNWERSGTASEIKISNLLNTAPYFLKLMEEKRLQLSKDHSIESGYSRSQDAVILFIKGVEKGKFYFLHQWDIKAEQFQLIGGRCRARETNIEAAKRELEEEISQHDLVYDRDYELILLKDKPVKTLEISRTYGALTSYNFWLYAVILKLDSLRLSEVDKWISLEEMKSGVTRKGSQIRNQKLHKLFNETIPGGMEKIPFSIEVSKTVNYYDFIDVKPGIGGISFDIKGALQNWWRK